MSGSYFTTGKELARRLREIAEKIDFVGEISQTHLMLHLQVVENQPDVAARVAAIDTMADHLELGKPINTALGSGQFSRKAGEWDLKVWGIVPTPIEEQQKHREHLMAELAKLDEAIGANTAPKLTREEDDLLRESLGSAYDNVPDPAAFMAEMRAKAALTPDAPSLPDTSQRPESAVADVAAISDERKAQILAEVNEAWHEDEDDAYIRALDESVNTGPDDGRLILAFELTDGTQFKWIDDKAWVMLPPASVPPAPAVDTISATPKRWRDSQGDVYGEVPGGLVMLDEDGDPISGILHVREDVERQYGPLTPVEPEAVDTISAARVEDGAA